MSKEALIVFTPSGRRGRFPVGTPVLTAARHLGVDIDSVCGGRGICGRCQVRPGEGDFPKHGLISSPAHLGCATAVETRYRDKKGLGAGLRLSCQAMIDGDLVVDVPPESQVHRQIVRKRADVRAIDLDPPVRRYLVTVCEPDLHNPKGDWERVCDALADQWDLRDVTCGPQILRQLQKTLRAGKWQITLALCEHNRQVIGIWPGLKEQIYGVAVDLGSTTIAAHLCDLGNGDVVASSGVMNPQIRFGEDLMSRVSWVMMNPGGDRDMTDVVQAAIDDLIGSLADQAGLRRGDVVSMTLVGNPVMHHLFLGLDPTELGGAPFALAHNSGLDLPAREVNLNLGADGRVYILPCIAGHVGADTAGMILSEGPHLRDDITLLCDVGTNAEIVLGHRGRLLACSSPTGPAFEGAQISSGQRAAPGAIERIRIDPRTLEPRFRVIGSDHWSDEAAFAEDTKSIGVTGLCGSGIIEAIAELFLAGVILPDGTINGALQAQSERIVSDGKTFSYVIQAGTAAAITITQNDVRAIQLAKAALYAGVQLLMDKMGIEQVDRIQLAGAFGAHIDVKYAMILGLIPDCDLSRVVSAGNAAGTGARIALLNKGARTEIEQITQQIEKIETALEPKFQDHFINAMALPNRIDPFPQLRQAVPLPAPPAPTTERKRRRRRGAVAENSQ